MENDRVLKLLEFLQVTVSWSTLQFQQPLQDSTLKLLHTGLL